MCLGVRCWWYPCDFLNSKCNFKHNFERSDQTNLSLLFNIIDEKSIISRKKLYICTILPNIICELSTRFRIPRSHQGGRRNENMNKNEIVPIEMAQIPSVLFSTGWSDHQLIMSQCKSDEQRLFYILYSGHEQLESKHWYSPLQRCRYGSGTLCIDS